MIPSLSHTTFSTGNYNDPGWLGTREIVLVFILGLVIRFFDKNISILGMFFLPSSLFLL